MMEVSDEKVDRLYKILKKEAESSGYHLNPDEEFAKFLVRGLLVNEKRYGYRSCPCRLASGVKAEDIDIICPCDYRDDDLVEFDQCYCGLYVTEKVLKGEKEVTSIPERRKAEEDRKIITEEGIGISELKYPIWRCKVCGYLCARISPPEACPICRASRERFERFI